MEKQKTYLCKECGKEYKHRQNLSRHMKLKHQYTPKPPKIYHSCIQKPPQNDYICRYCNKCFSFSSGKYRHEKKCKNKQNPEDMITKEQHKAELYKLEKRVF